MVFSSNIFIFFFLPAAILCYYAVPSKFKNAVLLIFSLVFYSWGEPVYILIMLFSTVFDYANGLLIQKFQTANRNNFAKAVLCLSVIGNLSVLCFFKYSSFLVDNINSLLGSSLEVPSVSLPVGISFYTFQTMSYTIDVYRKQANAQKNIVDFGAFVTMFPQLVAGPIVQYKDIEQQLKKHSFSKERFLYGISRFIQGLSKKVLLANNIGILWEQISASHKIGLATAWLGAAAFAFQIYFDFSGYSDMAIGLGEMFGFTFRENFDRPYASKSITEFWRRWHISLGSWFREYVYIPLGGNRRGKARQIFNILTVWFLTGLWHGASWNFAVWGAYFGIILLVEKFFLLKHLEKLPAFFSRFYCLFTVTVSWVIFAFDNLSDGIAYLGNMFGASGRIFTGDFFFLLSSNALLILLCVIFGGKGLARFTLNRKIFCYMKPAALCALFIVSVCFLVGDSYNPFLYFRF